MAYREYLLQVERNPTAFSGRRVLAAVLMKSPNSDVTVLSLGTGKKFTSCPVICIIEKQFFAFLDMHTYT